jgi:hypothetical protein
MACLFLILLFNVFSTTSNSDESTWAIGPALQCVNLIAEETRIASLLQRAITALAHQEPLLELARQKLRDTKNDLAAIDRLIIEQKDNLGQWAKELILDDYDSINKHGIIGLWVALEVAIEDTAVLILTTDVSSHKLVINTGVDKLSKKLSQPLTEIEARKIYRKLETHSRNGRSVAEGYSHLLSILNISLILPSEIIALLNELNYVRNCLLHRGGIIDERARHQAPNLLPQLGKNFKMSSLRYRQYFDAAGKFAIELLRGVSSSPYVRIKK